MTLAPRRTSSPEGVARVAAVVVPVAMAAATVLARREVTKVAQVVPPTDPSPVGFL